MSVKTIATCRTGLIARLGLESKADLVRQALRHELID